MQERQRGIANKLGELRQKHIYASVVEVAYWTIRDAIRKGIIRGGERLMEVPIAEALGMSRTPVREALRRLEAERLVENIPRRGLIVPEVTLEDLQEIFDIRELLEGLAARRAATFMSPVEIDALHGTVERMEQALKVENFVSLSQGSSRFHDLIHSGSKNSRLPKLTSLLSDSHRSIWLHQLAPERAGPAVAEHRAIYEAVATHKPDEAERLMREHIRNALRAHIRAHQEQALDW